MTIMNNSEVFDFGFAVVKVRITGKVGVKLNQETGEQYPYVHAIFKNEIGLETKHQCSQEDPMADVKKDVELIKSGRISGTKFYKHWIKLFFKDRGKVKLVEDADPLFIVHDGEYFKQNSLAEKTFYFMIDGKKEKLKGYYFEENDMKYLL